MSNAIRKDAAPRVAFVGSYLPRQCGIATFTHDLASIIAEDVYGESLVAGGPVKIVAINDRDNRYEYPPHVDLQIRQHRKDDYRNAAEYLDTSKVDLICLQHEYGLFGGPDGVYLLELLDRLRKPVVTTLHTVLDRPTPGQRDVLRRICERSYGIVVMSRRAEEILVAEYDARPERVHQIHHGTPDVPFDDPEKYKGRFDLEGRPVILTFGLLNPNKGIEVTLDALANVVPDFPDVAYLVLGVTHPLVRRESGESYRLSLESRVVTHGIQRNVIFHNRYVSLSDLCEYLMAADIYVTPYFSREQIVSGTLAYALATGRAIVSTPYYYAQELLAEDRGRLVEFGDSDALAANLHELLRHPDRRTGIRQAAYDYGRSMIWSEVGRRYVEIFDDARSEAMIKGQISADHRIVMRMSLPGIRLNHLHQMTDDTGLIQHSIYSTPNRQHGYTTDDNSRALLVMAMIWNLLKDEEVLPHLQTYLSFLHHASTGQRGRFHNFMAYDRRWLDEEGGDDCQGRVVWALGELIAKAPNEPTLRLAEDLYQQALETLPTIESIRGKASAVLGIHAYLTRHPDDSEARSQLAAAAGDIAEQFTNGSREGWPWYEDIVTYDNARMPQALIMAGSDLGDRELVDHGLKILAWLLQMQTSQEGCLSIIGNEGWLRPHEEMARFDQQPLEVAALVGACKAAHRATGDPRWLVEMRRCFEWFLGRNDLGCLMINFKTRGCHDGLTPSGVNANQGAESLVAWLLALVIMHEMQTGDAPEIQYEELAPGAAALLGSVHE